jgi:hypothetical protein
MGGWFKDVRAPALRWGTTRTTASSRAGALAKSEEASTCKRHAPLAQRARMTDYRPWFREQCRPPRALVRA